MSVLTLGLSHRTAPLALREQVTFSDLRLNEALSSLTALEGIQEGVIVSTCNRTEIHVIAPPCRGMGELLLDWLIDWHGLFPGALGPDQVYVYRGRDSVRQILRVACGLDSMVLGEPQILGQMKRAFRTAGECAATGPLLSRLFQHAFSVAKSVRTDTEIGSQPVSVAFAAVTLARRIFTEFAQQTALLIGAGETIELTARHLRDHGIGTLLVANRDVERAQSLAAAVHGHAMSLDEVPAHLSLADIVVASTASPQPLVRLETVKAAVRRRRHKPIFMLDLAVPRDIEATVAELEDIYLYTIDDLEQVVQSNLRSREQAALSAEEIVSRGTEDFMAWLRARDASATIRALRANAAAERDLMLTRAQRQLAAGKPPEEVLAFLANTLTKRLMHAPSAALRKADATHQEAMLAYARTLFDLKSPSKGD